MARLSTRYGSRPTITDTMTLHPIVARASRGELPEWTVAGPARRAHMARVAALMDEWGRASGISEGERARWRAAGNLHDILRDAPFDALRPRVPAVCHDLPGPMLHAPAAAERLRSEGVDDGELLMAVANHPLGNPHFGPLGRALYTADFLEPGRTYRGAWLDTQRNRMPNEPDEVLKEVVRARIGYALERGRSVPLQTVDFWNAVVGGRR